MTFLEVLLVSFLAIIIAVVFFYVLKSTGPWDSFWSFMLILVLAGLAAEAWITPIGPVAYGVTWIPTMFTIIIFALLLGAASPKREKEKARKKGELTREENMAIAISAFFWILLVVMLAIVFWGVFADHPL